MFALECTLSNQKSMVIEKDEGECSDVAGSNSESEMNDKEIRTDTLTLDGLLLCPFPGCLKDFSTRWSLNRHSRVHSGVKPYKCSYCSKDFAQNCSLKRHEQTHTQERQWICSFAHCGKRFKLKEYLEVHHQRSHTKEELMELQQPPEPTVDQGSTAATATIEHLRERLVRMAMRHHDQLYFHQDREQQLVMGLQECSSALDRALQIILQMNGGDISAIPLDMRGVAMKYSTQRWPLTPPTGAMPVNPLPLPFSANGVPRPHALAAVGEVAGAADGQNYKAISGTEPVGTSHLDGRNIGF